MSIDVNAVIASMTLEEKCACLTGEGYWVLGGCPRLGVEPIRVSDGPHGLRKQSGEEDNLGLSASEPAVAFPTASAAACTFDAELIEVMGEALGDEARQQDVAVLLGPGVNMKRSPLCGRNFEYYSEDPHLAGMLGAAYIKGVQSRGVGTSLKHFACNNQETNRLICDSVVDDRALAELYLEPFRIAVEQGKPWTIMTAYNLLNATYCSENTWLMNDVARKTWGFEGTFVTDWGAENSNELSLINGLDLVMPGPRPDYRADIASAVQAGIVPQEKLDEALRHILELHVKHEAAREVSLKRSVDERLEVARVVAQESAVLLENSGILPLDPTASLAVIGAFAKEPRYQGAGSSKINPLTLDCAFDELVASGVLCSYAPGYESKDGSTTEELLVQAEQLAADAEVVVVFVGLPDTAESEGTDRKDMSLPEGHNALIERVCAANSRVVVVLQGGSPVELPWRDKPQAVLLSYLSGCRGGRATADLLLGHINPSGKLAETWPLHLADTPCVNNFPEPGRQAQYRESIFTGYRFFDAAQLEVAYPFGYGLSYTTFSYHDLRVKIGDGVACEFMVSCKVVNTGTCAGKDAVQLYVAPLDPGVFKAPQQLKGFTKVSLEPGEERRIEFCLPRQAFTHYDAASSQFKVEGGTYEIRVAASSRDVRLRARVEVMGLPKGIDGAPQAYHQVTKDGFTSEAFRTLYGRAFPKVVVPRQPYTPNATIGDLRASLVGRVVHYVIRRELNIIAHHDPVMRKLATEMVMETPLRSLAMSGVDMNLVAGLVDILNYRFIRGFKRLRGAMPSVKQEEDKL